jgi:hypothetical protein
MKRLLQFPILLLLAACGAVFNGSTDVVSFSSEPPGATVLVNGMPVGRTPLAASLDSRRSQNVEFRLDGYEPRVVVLNSSLTAGYLILDIVPGLVLWIIPLVVDAATGDWNNLDQSHVHAVLDPVRPAP